MPPHRTRGDLGPKELLRILIVALGWVGFVWMWVLVGRQPWDSGSLVWLIVGALIIAPLLTFVWVVHNRAIFRRKGERRAVAAADFSYAKDWHGRTISADWAQLAQSRFVTIDAEDAMKVYRCRDSELARGLLEPARAAPACATQDDTRADKPLPRH